MNSRIAIPIAALVVLVQLGCGLGNLIFAPIDLVRPFKWGSIARNPDAGPIEAALMQAAKDLDAEDLILDTPDRDFDPKLLARACDEGDARQCGGPAELFYFFLDRRDLGTALFERACEAGDVQSCERAGDAHSVVISDRADWGRAAHFYKTGCDLDPPTLRVCSRAQATYRADWSYEAGHRACSVGDGTSCDRLAKTTDDPILVAYYQELSMIGTSPLDGASQEPSFLAFKRERSQRQFPELWALFSNLEKHVELEREKRARKVLSKAIAYSINWQVFDFSEEYLARSRFDPKLCGLTANITSRTCALLARAPLPEHIEVEGSRRCMACIDPCPMPKPRVPSNACLCGCLLDNGGCGIEADVLNQCMAAPGTTR